MSAASTLSDFRAEKGLTLAQMAEAVGLSARSGGWISEIENGTRDASPLLAIRIERFTGGRVPAASVCRKLADEHGPASPGPAPEGAPAPASVTLESEATGQ